MRLAQLVAVGQGQVQFGVIAVADPWMFSNALQGHAPQFEAERAAASGDLFGVEQQKPDAAQDHAGYQQG